ncbi:restriction endonuclease [Citricoccus nitrophenolicus]|uniref:restriction endonuclease n=1 Tax=Citricoccus nitrophenolicus TaxID=863575 RepID=UPI0031E80210
MKAWVVRAGLHGEHEKWNIDNGRVTIGWSEVGDIGACQSRQDVRDLLTKVYPADPEGRISNYTSQLWSFRNRIKVGDLIVMPLKTQPGYIRFGSVSGEYGYDAENPNGDRRKYLPVQWNAEPVSKTGIEADLMYSLNAIMTVFSPSRNDAVNRLVTIAKTGVDPGNPYEVSTATAAGDNRDDSEDEVTDPHTAPTLEAIRDRIRSHITEHFKEHELTGLVADILSAHGFQCEVSPPGPDGGVDIIAGMGPLGLDSPTVVVEVKSEPGAIDSRVVRGLHSARVQHNADQALLVAWGGVTKPARQEFRRDRTFFRIWDGEELLNELLSTYEHLPAETRARIPLQQAWVLDDDG